MSIKETTFQVIKKVFTTALILQHIDSDIEYTMEPNASNYVFTTVISQPDHESILQPVTFMSLQHLPAECNYEIYNKEPLAIVQAFEK